jgi:hypothetical protein
MEEVCLCTLLITVPPPMYTHVILLARMDHTIGIPLRFFLPTQGRSFRPSPPTPQLQDCLRNLLSPFIKTNL